MTVNLLTVPPGPGGVGVQRIYLLPSHFSDLGKCPQVVQCHWKNNLIALCRPVIQLQMQASFVALNPSVTQLKTLYHDFDSVEATRENDLTHVARHWVALQTKGPPQAFEVSASMQMMCCTGRYAKAIEITVVTSEVGFSVSPRELAEALSPFIIGSHCLVDMRDTPAGAALGIVFVFIHAISNAESNMAYQVKANKTKVGIRAKVCLDRIASLQKPTDRKKLAGVECEQQRLSQILSREAKLGLRGVLLTGPPGSGKTNLLQEISKRSGYMLLSHRSSDLLRAEQGATAQAVTDLFRKAEQHAQEGGVVMALEDIESLCPSHNDAKPHDLLVFQCMLSSLDKLAEKAVSGRPTPCVVAVTHRPAAVHAALRRSGRLSDEVTLGIPDISERRLILQSHWPEVDDALLDMISQHTPGYVGADLARLARALKVELKSDSAKTSSDKDTQLKEALLENALKSVPPSGFKSGLGTVNVSHVQWDSIGGLQSTKGLLKRALEWPLKWPYLFQKFGLRPSRGCLLYGPPGCGKTKLARAAASTCGAVFLAASAASIFSPYVGDSEKAVAELFSRARMASPSVLFIDEIDALVSAREGRSAGVKEKVLSTLLNEMDGISVGSGSVAESRTESALETVSMAHQSLDPLSGGRPLSKSKARSTSNMGHVIIMCATNRPHALDAALCRPGRLDHLVYVPPPDQESREEILQHFTKDMPLMPDVELSVFAKATDFYSGADLESVCREAALHALTMAGLDAKDVRVSTNDFKEALAKVPPSLSQDILKEYESFSL